MSVFMPLVARPAAVRALRDCYEILGDLTPLKSNCGKLCVSAEFSFALVDNENANAYNRTGKTPQTLCLRRFGACYKSIKQTTT